MKLFLLSTLLLLVSVLPAQQTINGTMSHDGRTRVYILYVPASYSPESPAPLVFNFHGYTSNANSQMGYGDFRPIADTAGFLIVHPMGLLDGNGTTHFNADWGTGVNDIGYAEALIDKIAEDYSIDRDRVYSTGMSNGGYMSYTLACRLSEKIAAVASVTGSMTRAQLGNAPCNPQRPVPVMQLHGTQDNVVPYFGNDWSARIDDVVAYWVGHNQCEESPTVENLPNVNTNDGSTAQLQRYGNGDLGVEVQLYKITGGGHTWPGARFSSGSTNQDFNASEKIWQFFNRFDLNGLRETGITSIDPDLEKGNIQVFVDPITGSLHLKNLNFNIQQIQILNSLGQSVFSNEIIRESQIEIATASFPQGIYIVQALNKSKQLVGAKKVLFGM